MRRAHGPLFALLLVLLTCPVHASMEAGYGTAADAVTLEQAGAGSLMVPAGGEPVRYIPLPGLSTEARIDVTGAAAHVEISQVFHNPSTRWLEAVYVFPLPESGALTKLHMRVADRLIEGVVREKRQARQEYTEAKQAGRKAGLVEQQRPNLFTSSVANIPPGESITITLSYLDTPERTGDEYALRVPLVAGPRYMPPAGSLAADPPPLANPNTIPPQWGKVNPVTLSFELNAGFELAAVDSPHHEVEVSRPAPERAAGRLTGRHYADRDFELRWRAALGTAPGIAVFVDRDAGDAYVMLMVQPPLPDAEPEPAPRELILVIDASGSMHGGSIEQALAAARFALSTLRGSDRFNVIRFSDAPDMLFPSPQPAGAAALAEAERFVSRIEANGGTNIAAALRRAFDNPAPTNAVRQLVFLTDGAVGNESVLFNMIEAGTRDARLFTVGIGSAPNGYFMRRAARAGRGTYTFIGRVDEVRSKMAGLFERIRHPVLTDIRIDWHGAAAGMQRTADLFRGEPLVLTARIPGFQGATLRGLYAGSEWTRVVEAGRATAAPWISTLWARDRIRELEDDLRGGGDRERVEQRMIEIGVEHQLVTPFTSLVAVEHRVSRDAGEPLYRADAPANLPHGWSYRHVFGSLPQTALGWRARTAAGLALMAFALILLCVTRRRSPA